MNYFKFLSRSLFILCILTIAMISCENESDNPGDFQGEQIQTRIVEEQTRIDDILLPKGTKVSIVSDTQIDIELPSNFEFLLYDDKDGVRFSKFGSYSCACSAKNSCKVFYNPSVGYGCLQNSCTGSCTGTPTSGDIKKPVYGIINNTSSELLGEKFTSAGHLTPRGYEIFFEYIAKEKLMEFFDFAFIGSDYKNGTELIAEKGKESTTHVVLQYKGISFSAVVPNFDEHKENQMIDFQRGPSISCAGNNGCSCSQDKTCFLGNCVYYCDGCTTCTMTVDEK